MYKIQKLKNGLRLLRLPREGVESVSVLALVRTGSRYESERVYGVAHFLEHMVFKGTTAYPSAKIVSETVDGIGAEFNAFTGEEATCFYLRCASKDVELAIKMLGELTTQSLLEPAEIERERGVILEEIHMYQDEPGAHAADLFNAQFYAGSGLAHNILGRPETINKLTQQDFIDYLDTWYGPENMLIVVAGKPESVNRKNLHDLLSASFCFPASRRHHPAHQKLWQAKLSFGQPLKLERKKIEQVHFVLGFPGLTRFDEREEVMSLLSTIAGGNMSSRLFREVREQRGLCYYIHTFNDYFSDCGGFGASAGVNPRKLLEALEVTLTELQSLAAGKKAVSAAELQRAKNYLTGQLTLAQESVHGLAVSYGLRCLHGEKVKTIAQRLAAIEKVNLAQVRELAAQIVRSKQARLTVLGNYTPRQAEQLKKLFA